MNETNQTQYQQCARPVGQLKANRSLLVTILLSAITFGIYGIVTYCGITNDLNVLASRYDGRRTMHFALLMFLIGPITAGIAYIVWIHKICARMGNELTRRNIAYSFGADTFWLWGFLGSFIFIGPFVFAYKMFKASNLLCANYNVYG